MTVVAGVGGVVALVIAYRRQRDLEQSRFVVGATFSGDVSFHDATFTCDAERR
ncbi:hypothetical protein [Nocardia sp. NPDC057455]|uniref:hypothetical protein n=1 Tax=Nocardia sp. NPDC057455 TaxID=3346138 RepID=UPI0036715548